MKDAKQILMDFIEEATSGLNYFKTKDGKNVEGWIDDIDGDDIIVWTHGPMDDSSEPSLYPISSIDVYTLAYYGDATKGWVEFGQRLKEQEG